MVNQQTWNTIVTKITKDFKDEALNEPDFKVYPQMRKVKDFFKGGYEKYSDEILETKKSRHSGRFPGKAILKNQMIKEKGFFYENEDRNEAITKDELLELIIKKHDLNPSEKLPYTAVVASAGSGKTTLLRRLAEETLHVCPTFRCESQPAVAQSNIKMVYYVEMKNLKYEEDLKPSQLLFGGLYETESDEDDAYRWLLHHQSEAVLYFDGLDQTTWMSESTIRMLKPFERGNSSEIFYNILSRTLLPHVKIVISSREFKISELPADARPEHIISLAGLKQEDAERVLVFLLGPQGSDTWDAITKCDQRLLNLLSIPVFLILTAAVLAKDCKQPPPGRITTKFGHRFVAWKPFKNEGRFWMSSRS